jgi:sterol desaturase/sphingolipid hydroxylase (fatty acid hydroxylase superfamily)
MNYEPLIRLACFVGVLGGMAAWEVVAPRRRLTTSKLRRWFSNLAIATLNAVAVRLWFALGAVGVALIASRHGWGLFNHVSLASGAEVLVSIIALDLVLYLQHVMFHAVPLLWRLHMVHHADLDFDVTTGIRFHPLEILLSMGIKAAAVIVLGAPPLAVLIFEVLLNASSLFNHGNVHLPLGVDRLLRCFVVTPDMHRVHHSLHADETNSNFGFNLPWWDFALGTYRPQPRDGHDQMEIGLTQFREDSFEQLHRLLLLPFAAPTADNPVNSQCRSERHEREPPNG